MTADPPFSRDVSDGSKTLKGVAGGLGKDTKAAVSDGKNIFSSITLTYLCLAGIFFSKSLFVNAARS